MGFNLEIIKKPTTLAQIKKHADEDFWDFTKAVVDINKIVIVVGWELHADEESILLQQGSKQDDLRWINIYPEYIGTKDYIEFDSMINIRPRQNNHSRSVENQSIRHKIEEIVHLLIKQ